MLTAEQQARVVIDRLLTAAGWVVEDVKAADVHAGRGVALREFELNPGHGTADYLLYVDGKAAGVIEAKKQGATLTGVEAQSARYAQGLPAALPAHRRPLPFLYESTGLETHFTNGLDPEPVDYNPAFPNQTSDIIVSDEAHRFIYNLWRQMLGYFDAYLIGLTVTPNKRTFGFFNQNSDGVRHSLATEAGSSQRREPQLRRLPHQDRGHRGRQQGGSRLVAAGAGQAHLRPARLATR